jgi:hypothetical protein
MAPSRRSKACAPKTRTPWKLPMDLLLEIVARSNYRTLIRCAATCRLLRREILSPLLYRRITQASPSILAYLCDDTKKPLALLHQLPAPPSPSATNTSCNSCHAGPSHSSADTNPWRLVAALSPSPA